eukprot:958846-Pleurochrysis_carterae.AAC.1
MVETGNSGKRGGTGAAHALICTAIYVSCASSFSSTLQDTPLELKSKRTRHTRRCIKTTEELFNNVSKEMAQLYQQNSL